MPWATLGDIAFDIRTPAVTRAELTSGWQFAEHALIGRSPRLQFTGPKLRELTLTVGLTRALGDPEDELAKLRAAANSQQVLAFVWGHGAKVGDFVIEAMTTRVLTTQADGRLIEAEVDLTLKEVVEQTAKPKTGPAVRKK